MVFTVDVTEIVTRTLRIETTTVEDALNKIQQLCRNTETLLDYSDCVHVELSVTKSSIFTIDD